LGESDVDAELRLVAQARLAPFCGRVSRGLLLAGELFFQVALRLDRSLTFALRLQRGLLGFLARLRLRGFELAGFLRLRQRFGVTRVLPALPLGFLLALGRLLRFEGGALRARGARPAGCRSAFGGRFRGCVRSLP
jgi:hypothetical protein